MQKIDSNGKITVVPIGFVPIVEEYTDPEYTGGLYPLGEIVDLRAYIGYVEGQGGSVRDVNATCAVEGVTEVIYSSNEVTVVYTNKSTGEVHTETQTVTQDDNRLSFEALHLDAGNYRYEIILDNSILYRGSYRTEAIQENLTTTKAHNEPITGTDTSVVVVSDDNVEIVAQNASVDVLTPNKDIETVQSDKEVVVESVDKAIDTVQKDQTKTTRSRDRLYNYTSR